MSAIRRVVRRDRVEGFTLVELLLASTLMVIIIGALVTALLLALRTSVGLSDTSTANIQDSDVISAQVDSHIGIQTLSKSFVADVENANNPTDVTIAGASPGPSVYCTGGSGGPSLGTDTPLIEIVMRATDGTVTNHVTYVYSVDAHRHLGQIARYDCSGPQTSAPSARAITRGLSSTATPTVADLAPTASVPSHVFKLTVTTVSGRVYVMQGTPAVDASAPGGGGGAGTPPPPPFDQMDMQDVDHNGKVDRILLTYNSSTTLDASCANGWALTNVPSGGTKGVVTVDNSTHKITITVLEGSGAADTSTNDMIIDFTPQSSCNLLSFAGLNPIDDAPPVVLAVSDHNPTGNTDGKMEPGDSLDVTFSEPMDPATIPTDVTVTETAPNASSSNDSLTISGTPLTPSAGLSLTKGGLDLGSGSYLSAHGVSASYSAQVTLDNNATPTVVTVTIPVNVPGSNPAIPNPCTGAGCPPLLQASVGTFVFTPDTTTLRSLVAQPQATATATVPIPLGASPVPGPAFRMF